MFKKNFFEQNIENGLTKSHSRSRKKIPCHFFASLKTSLKYKEKNQTALSFPEIF